MGRLQVLPEPREHFLLLQGVIEQVEFFTVRAAELGDLHQDQLEVFEEGAGPLVGDAAGVEEEARSQEEIPGLVLESLPSFPDPDGREERLGAAEVI